MANSKATCDCEKQFTNVTHTDSQPLSQKTTIKEKSDDLFAHVYGNPITHIIKLPVIKSLSLFTTLQKGHIKKFFQPPRV